MPFVATHRRKYNGEEIAFSKKCRCEPDCLLSYYENEKGYRMEYLQRDVEPIESAKTTRQTLIGKF